MSVINILYPFDNNYAPYAGISLTSLLGSNKSAAKINIYILGFDLSDDTVDKLTKTADRYDRTIHFIDPTPVDDHIRSLGLPSYRGARIAVARLFVSEFIPEGIDRLLYLDSDTIVVGDLSKLMSADLGGLPAGMACDSVARDYKRILGFDKNDDYYNGGMILYDINEWKKRDCTGLVIDHIKNVRKNYEALDQDLINIVLKGQIKRLDLRYNLQPFHVIYPPKTYLKVYGSDGYYSLDEIKKATKNVVILHTFRYLGMFPWHKNTLHPCKKEFDHYKSISKWANLPDADEPKQSLAIRIERILRLILPNVMFLRLFRFVFKQNMIRIEKKIQSTGKYSNA